MSILIRGMEMPRKCIRCPVNVYGRCLVNDDKDVSKAAADAVRDKDCPLISVQPHGGLIEKQAIYDLIRSMPDVDMNLPVEFMKALYELPTIIPADKEGAEE